MKSSQTDTLLLALQLGILTGFRSMAGLTILSNYASNNPKRFKKTQFALLASDNANMFLRVGAAGEMVVDKLPFVGDRTSPPQLMGRITFAALAGAALCAGRKESLATGAVAAGVGAIIGSFVGVTYRHLASGPLHLPNLIAGLVEDAAVVYYGASVLGPQLEA